MEPFLGQIMMFGGNFAPKGWAFCNGQLLSISQNTALFSLLGTTYGGDGVTTFALPDLRGRAPVGMGQGAGLTERQLGESFGAETLSETTVTVAGRARFPPGAGTAVDSGTDHPSTVPPSLGVNFIIALEGIYPSRS